MNLYLLAVSPLTFYAACSFLREGSPQVTFDLWRRFSLGALFALPGYVAAAIVADWFGYSYRPANLFVRLSTNLHIIPAAMGVGGCLLVQRMLKKWARRGDELRSSALNLLAVMSGFNSTLFAVEYFSGNLAPNVEQLLILPTLRTTTVIGLSFAWMIKVRLPLAASVVAASVLFPGVVTYLYAAGFFTPAVVLSGIVAFTGVAALLRMRSSP